MRARHMHLATLGDQDSLISQIASATSIEGSRRRPQGPLAGVFSLRRTIHHQAAQSLAFSYQARRGKGQRDVYDDRSGSGNTHCSSEQAILTLSLKTLKCARMLFIATTC